MTLYQQGVPVSRHGHCRHLSFTARVRIVFVVRDISTPIEDVQGTIPPELARHNILHDIIQ